MLGIKYDELNNFCWNFVVLYAMYVRIQNGWDILFL